jgi:hypothetical protein
MARSDSAISAIFGSTSPSDLSSSRAGLGAFGLWLFGALLHSSKHSQTKEPESTLPNSRQFGQWPVFRHLQLSVENLFDSN